MANVAFKRGAHASLPWKSAQDGVFYLTEDTHRLYVGQGSELIDLNRYIKTVANVTALAAIATGSPAPEEGDFYYVQDGNMLVVWEKDDSAAIAGAGHFVQINAYTDTNTDTELTAVTSTAAMDANKENVVVTQTFKQVTTDEKTGGTTNVADVTTTFNIPVGDLVSAGVNVGVDATIDADGKILLANAGTGANTGKAVGFKAGDNVSLGFDADNDVITVSATDSTYTLESGAGSTAIVLNADAGADSTVTLVSGTQISLDGAAEGKITVNHGAITTTPNDTTSEIVDLVDEGTFEVIDSLTIDNGHITGYTKKKYELNDSDTTYTVESVTADNTGAVSVALKDSTGAAAKTTKSGQVLYYTVDINGTKHTIYNQGSLNPIVEYVDDKLQDLNALTYKGVITQTSGLPSNVPNGSVYMVSEAGTYGTQSADVGDLFIATGTENADGVIASPTWTYVPSGDDTDTQFELAGTGNKIVLSNDVNSNKDEISVVSGVDITATVSDDTFTISHSDVTRDDSDTVTLTPAAGGTVKVVTEVVSSVTGHVTDVKTANVTLPKDTNTTYDLSTAANGTNKADIKLTGTNNDNSSAGVDTISITTGTDNSSLNLDVADGAINIEHKNYNYTAPTGITTGNVNYGSEVTIVTGATVENGHVTGLTTGKIKMPASDNVTYDLAGTSTVADDSKSVTFTSTLSGSDSSSDVVTQVLNTAHENIKFTATTNGATISFEWGTF